MNKRCMLHDRNWCNVKMTCQLYSISCKAFGRDFCSLIIDISHPYLEPQSSWWSRIWVYWWGGGFKVRRLQRPLWSWLMDQSAISLATPIQSLLMRPSIATGCCSFWMIIMDFNNKKKEIWKHKGFWVPPRCCFLWNSIFIYTRFSCFP